MKLTTLLHGIDPTRFRKIVFLTTIRLFLPLFICVTILAVGFESIASEDHFAFAAIVSSLIFLLMPFLIGIKASVPSIIAKNNRLTFDRKRIIEFDDAGMNVRFDSGSHSFMVWGDVEFARYSDDIVRIFITKNSIHLIPDTAWPSTNERDQFLSLLRSKGLLK